jgi:hypothetical protein
MVTGLTLVAALITGQPQADTIQSVANCLGGRPNYEGLNDLRRAYAWRSVQIIDAALSEDVTALSQMISPAARFSVARGDAGFAPRGLTGPRAAIQFFRGINPVKYQFSPVFAGPLSADACATHAVELLLHGGRLAANLSFTFEQGMLIRVDGAEVIIDHGRFPITHP